MIMKKPVVAALLSFNGGFVDTAGFLGLQGLFTAHVTGNFVTLGAALVFGTHGIIAKLLALPEFIIDLPPDRLPKIAFACVIASNQSIQRLIGLPAQHSSLQLWLPFFHIQ